MRLISNIYSSTARRATNMSAGPGTNRQQWKKYQKETASVTRRCALKKGRRAEQCSESPKNPKRDGAAQCKSAVNDAAALTDSGCTQRQASIDPVSGSLSALRAAPGGLYRSAR